ncbi:MAG TPA: TIGR03066 family protein [Gemmata sp.]|nr:TIGR03066 family protein [Gemmata sp.]
MRTILGCAAILALACGASFAGQTKVDAKKLVGKWAPAPEKDKKEKPLPMVIEFTADGKVSMTVGAPGAEHRVDGTYSLAADKLSVQLKVREMDVKETLTIKKLTDDELTTEDSKGKAETMKRKR